MTKYWVSWISGNYADEGCTKPHFKYWITDQLSGRRSCYPQFFIDGPKNDMICVALITTESEEEIWNIIGQYFPDYDRRFINIVSEDWVPPQERFS